MKPPPKSQRRAMYGFAVAIALILGLIIWRLARPVPEYTWTGAFMGQPYTIIVKDRQVNFGVKQMMDVNLPQLLIQLESRFSRVPGVGLVAEFNRSDSTLPTYVGTEMWRVVNLQKRLSKNTAAADITIAHLYEAWDRVRAKQIQPLTPDAAKDLLRDAGMDRLLAPAEGYIRKLKPSVNINIDSAAQGYAIDQVEIFMIDNKISHFHAQIGGTVLSRDMPAYSSSVPINYAFGADSAVTSRVNLGSSQMATRGRGDGFNTLDPRTGLPVANNVYSVSVIAESGMIAASMATILYILGPTEGLRWLETNGVAPARVLYFLDIPGKELVRTNTPNFPVDAEKLP